MDAGAAPGVSRPVAALLALLLAVLLWQAAGACLDFVAAVRSPIEIDYGEGIIWQQAALMTGPRMYPVGADLPFIVFHYPPLYHLTARAMDWLTPRSMTPDLFAAGRLVAGLSALAVVPLVAGTVGVAAGRRGWWCLVIALCAGLLALTLHATRAWGQVMRVDSLAIAFSLAGVLVACRADGRWFGTTCALLLCVAAVFTKQTQLPAGIAVAVVALMRRPREGLIAVGIAGAAGLAALVAMQVVTGGGFLQNILGYNVNRLALRHFYWVFWPERFSLPVMLLIAVSMALLSAGLWRRTGSVGGIWRFVRASDGATAARLIVLLQFALASVFVLLGAKSGSHFNYLLEWLAVGCIVVGIVMVDYLASPRLLPAFAAVIIAWALFVQPQRLLPDQPSPAALAQQAALIRRIADAEKPVASEEMTVLMRAGKPIIFEPSIVSELAAKGRWDETPLVEMIRSGGFAFMITTDNDPANHGRRTPAVDTAMRAAFPNVEKVGPRLWLHTP